MDSKMDISREEDSAFVARFEEQLLGLGELIVKIAKVNLDSTKSVQVDSAWKEIYDRRFGNTINKEEAMVHSSQVVTSFQPKVVLTKKASSQEL